MSLREGVSKGESSPRSPSPLLTPSLTSSLTLESLRMWQAYLLAIMRGEPLKKRVYSVSLLNSLLKRAKAD